MNHAGKQGFLWSVWLVLATALVSQAQEGVRTVPFEGTQAFCQILRAHGLEPLQHLGEFVGKRPEETLLIVFGDTSGLIDLCRRLKSFHEQGGAVLLASDRTQFGSLQQRPHDWNLWIDRRQVVEDKDAAYRQEPSCPLIHPADARHPLFKNFSAEHGLASNGPSYLRRPFITLPELAHFGSDCRLDYMPKPGPKEPKEILIYMAGSARYAPPKDRVLIMAGHGVFFNGMLVQEDNNNFQFAWNAVRWLRDSPAPEGKRKYVLLVEDGSVVSSFDMPLSIRMPPPAPPVPTVALFNRLLRGLEDENAFNKLLLQEFGREALLRSMLLLMSCVLVIHCARRLMKSRFTLERHVPLVIDPVLAAPPALPVPELRRQALAALDNYWEPAQALVRQWFWEHAGIAPADWDAGEVQVPPLAFQGSWWQRRRLVRKQNELCRLAQSAPTEAISGRKFQRINEMLQEMTAALSKPPA